MTEEQKRDQIASLEGETVTIVVNIRIWVTGKLHIEKLHHIWLGLVGDDINGAEFYASQITSIQHNETTGRHHIFVDIRS